MPAEDNGYFDAKVDNSSWFRNLQEMINKLCSFDHAYEIHAYCDDVEAEILLTFDSAIQNLNEAKQELLAEIHSYRSGLVQVREALHKSEEWLSIQDELADLSRDIEELHSKSTTETIEFSEDIDQIMEETKCQMDEYTKRAKDLSRRMRETAFGKRFMRFKPNYLFPLSRDNLGIIELIEKEEVPFVPGQSIITEERSSKSQNCHLSSIQYIPEEYAAFGTKEGLIKLYHARDHQKSFIYDGIGSPVLCMIVLFTELLVTGTEDGTVCLWGLKRIPSKKLIGHTGPVFALKRMRNGLIASMSTDNTIKIWDHYIARTQGLLMTIPGHDCTKTYSKLGMLSNGYLVTCSDDLLNGIIRIWNPRNGRKMKELESKVGEVVALAIMLNDDIVVGSKNGTLRIVNIFDDSFSKTLIGPRENIGISDIVPAENGWLIVAESSSSPNVQFWDSPSGKLLESVPSGHTAPIKWLQVHPDKRHFSTVALDENMFTKGFCLPGDAPKTQS